MLKKYFSAGLLLWIPLAVTLWVLETIIRWSDSFLALLPPPYHPDTILGVHIPGVGLVLAASIVLVTGILVANYFGQWVVRLWERFLERIPVVRPLYSGAKKIAATLLSDQTDSFKEVVLVEFPLPDRWTLAFIVSHPEGPATEPLGRDDLVTVYVPTAPNPTSGYVLMLPKSAIRRTNVSVDQAFKFHLSLGVMIPEPAPEQKVEAESTDKPAPLA